MTETETGDTTTETGDLTGGTEDTTEPPVMATETEPPDMTTERGVHREIIEVAGAPAARALHSETEPSKSEGRIYRNFHRDSRHDRMRLGEEEDGGQRNKKRKLDSHTDTTQYQ